MVMKSKWKRHLSSRNRRELEYIILAYLYEKRGVKKMKTIANDILKMELKWISKEDVKNVVYDLILSGLIKFDSHELTQTGWSRYTDQLNANRSSAMAKLVGLIFKSPFIMASLLKRHYIFALAVVLMVFSYFKIIDFSEIVSVEMLSKTYWVDISFISNAKDVFVTYYEGDKYANTRFFSEMADFMKRHAAWLENDDELKQICGNYKWQLIGIPWNILNFDCGIAMEENKSVIFLLNWKEIFKLHCSGKTSVGNCKDGKLTLVRTVYADSDFYSWVPLDSYESVFYTLRNRQWVVDPTQGYSIVKQKKKNWVEDVRYYSYRQVDADELLWIKNNSISNRDILSSFKIAFMDLIKNKKVFSVTPAETYNEGCARIRRVFDNSDIEISYECLWKNNMKKINNDGYSEKRSVVTFTEGSIEDSEYVKSINETYLWVNGEKVNATPDDWTYSEKMTYFDKNDRVVAERFFGTDGFSTILEADGNGIKYSWKSYQHYWSWSQVAEMIYLSKNWDQLITDWITKINYDHDSKWNEIQTVFLGIWNRLAINEYWVSIIKAKFDGEWKQIEETLYGKDWKPIDNIWWFQKWVIERWKSDNLNRRYSKVIRYSKDWIIKKSGILENKDAFSIIFEEFDENSNQILEWYFNEKGWERIIIKRAFDSEWLLIGEEKCHFHWNIKSVRRSIYEECR